MRNFLLLLVMLDSAYSYSARRRATTYAESRWPPNTACSTPICSEQVHIALGGPGEMVVVYTTRDSDTPSSVQWWEVDGDAGARTANGTVNAYSQLLFLDVMLTHPAVGAPEVSAEQIRSKQRDKSTSSKKHPDEANAVRPDGGEPDGVAYGLAAYNKCVSNARAATRTHTHTHEAAT